LPALLNGDKREYHESITVFDEYGPARMVRTKEWKWIHRYPYGPDELYDLLSDPDENFNLLEENRCFGYDNAFIERKVIEMRKIMEGFFRKYTDPNKDGRIEPVSGRGQLCKVGPESEGRLTFSLWKTEEYSRR
jgi:choline-sulfatase